MASSKDKKYPPGQKPAAKPTMAQAYKSAEKSTKPTPGSAAANRESLKNVGSSIVGFFAKGGIPAVGKPEGFNKPSSSKPVPPKEAADITAQAKAKDKKATNARMATDAKYDKVGPPAVVVKATAKAAKPYVKLKQAPREAARRAYVQKQLDRLGIKPTPAGKPRSAAEKAARVKARATWDKKNKFQKKSGPQSGGSGPMENRPE